MVKNTALYLAHLNPVTVAHTQIIDELRSLASTVIVMPVVFTSNGTEVNSRSFPFTFETRRDMIKSIFDDTVQVSKNYEFCAPFSQYTPPLLARASWSVRRQILSEVDGDYFTYTGDFVEWLMLKAYALKPVLKARRHVSATDVRQKMYSAVNTGDTKWQQDVPEQVSQIITRQDNWETIKRFGNAVDTTRRVLGMKFPV